MLCVCFVLTYLSHGAINLSVMIVANPGHIPLDQLILFFKLFHGSFVLARDIILTVIPFGIENN